MQPVGQSTLQFLPNNLSTNFIVSIF